MSCLVLPAMFEDLNWIVQRTGMPLTTDTRAIKAVDVRGIIRAMVAYNNWTDNAVFAHMACDTIAGGYALLQSRAAPPYGFPCPAFHYPFIQENREYLLGFVRSSNHRVLEIDRKLGFREVYRLWDGFKKGEDWVLMRMHRDECKWLKRAEGIPAEPHKHSAPSSTLGPAMEVAA